MVMAALVLLAAYLIGSIPFPVIVSRLVLGIDLRQHGSGNMGALNAGRVLGKKWFPVVMALDLAKGFAATWLAMTLIPGQVSLSPVAAAAFGGLFVVVGHCFPVFAGFKGGVGLAATGGALVAISFPMLGAAALAILVFWAISRNMYVGVAAASLLYPFMGWYILGEIWAVVAMAVWAAVVFALHWKDLKDWSASRKGA